MWEHRSIQGYSDSLRLHPIFDNEGYEKYSYTIRDEVIDCKEKKARIKKTLDYDQAGVVIPSSALEPESMKWVSTIRSLVETKVIDVFYTEGSNLSIAIP